MKELIQRIRTERKEAKKKMGKLARRLARFCMEDPENPLLQLDRKANRRVRSVYATAEWEPALLFDQEFKAMPEYRPYLDYLRRKGLGDLLKGLGMDVWFGSGDSKAVIREMLDNRNQGGKDFHMPQNLLTYLGFSSFTNGDFFGLGDDQFEIHRNSAFRVGIREGRVPPFMIRFLVLLEREDGWIGVWLGPRKVEDSEILHVDKDLRTIRIVSHSFENLVRRGLECAIEGVELNSFSPSERAREIIKKIEGDDVLPDGPSWSFDDVDSWPESWREIARLDVDIRKIGRPVIGEEKKLALADKFYAVEWLSGIGYSDEEIARLDPKPMNDEEAKKFSENWDDWLDAIEVGESDEERSVRLAKERRKLEIFDAMLSRPVEPMDPAWSMDEMIRHLHLHAHRSFLSALFRTNAWEARQPTPKDDLMRMLWRWSTEPDPTGACLERIGLKGYQVPVNVGKFLGSFIVAHDSGFFGEDIDEFRVGGLLKPLKDGGNSHEFECAVDDGRERFHLPDHLSMFMRMSTCEGWEIGVWVRPELVEDEEILMINLENREIRVLSGSMRNLVRRSFECWRRGVEVDLHDLSREAKAIFNEVEGGSVFPDGPVYPLDDVGAYPESWRRALRDFMS